MSDCVRLGRAAEGWRPILAQTAAVATEAAAAVVVVAAALMANAVAVAAAIAVVVAAAAAAAVQHVEVAPVQARTRACSKHACAE